MTSELKESEELKNLKDYKEKLKDDDPKKIICEVLCSLKKNLKSNEIFLSEADFKFSFAQKLDKVLREKKEIKSPIIILEYPFLTKELYNEDDITEGDTGYSNRMCIDLYYEYEEDNKGKKAVYIEFKYKTKGISGVKRGSSNKFTLQNHSNVTEQRHDIYKDIERIEHCLKWHKNNSKIKCFGYVVFITNNKSHWDKESKARKYRLCDGIACECHDNICTEKDYKLTWQPFNNEKNKENKEFKICLIDCNCDTEPRKFDYKTETYRIYKYPFEEFVIAKKKKIKDNDNIWSVLYPSITDDQKKLVNEIIKEKLGEKETEKPEDLVAKLYEILGKNVKATQKDS